MIIYYVVFFLIALMAVFSVTDKKNKSCYIWLIITLMTLFQGLRWNTGGDWAQYLWIYDKVSWDNFYHLERGQYARSIEWGYGFLNIAIKTVFSYYTIFLIITCGFINITYYCIINKYLANYQGIAMALAVCFSTMFPVRQVLSAAVFLWGIPYIINREWKKYFFVVFLSYTIHYSSILMIFAYWFDKRINRWILLVSYLFSFILVNYIPNLMNAFLSVTFFQSTSFGSLVEWYSEPIVSATSMNNTGMNTNFKALLLASSLIMLFGWIRNKQMNVDHNKERLINLLLNLYVMGCIGLNLALADGLSEFSRLARYSVLSIPILLTYCISTIRVYYKQFYWVFCFFVFALYTYHFISFFDDIYVMMNVPYYSVFEDSAPRGIWY